MQLLLVVTARVDDAGSITEPAMQLSLGGKPLSAKLSVVAVAENFVLPFQAGADGADDLHLLGQFTLRHASELLERAHAIQKPEVVEQDLTTE